MVTLGQSRAQKLADAGIEVWVLSESWTNAKNWKEKHWPTGAASQQENVEAMNLWGFDDCTEIVDQKRDGIRERLVACQINLQSQWRTLDAFFIEKHNDFSGVGESDM